MSEDAVWILEGHSEEAPQNEVHLYAQAKQHVTNRLSQTLQRLQDLDDKIDSISSREPMALALHAERLRVLFEKFPWQQFSEMQSFLDGVKVLVRTAGLARKLLQGNRIWTRNRRLEVLACDEIENASFGGVLSLAVCFKQLITAGDDAQRLERSGLTPAAM